MQFLDNYICTVEKMPQAITNYI